jgi:hypothetical protein
MVNIECNGDFNPLVQYKYTSTTASFSTSTQIPADDSIPTSAEGSEVLTLSITPLNANNILKIEFITFGYCSVDTLMTLALYQDAGAAAIATNFFNSVAGSAKSGELYFIKTAGTTSSTTFKVRLGPSSATTIYLNGAAGRYYGGVASTSLTIKEYQV